jgi:hypothetical protein
MEMAPSTTVFFFWFSHSHFSTDFEIKHKNKPMAPTILERGLPICGLRPKKK